MTADDHRRFTILWLDLATKLEHMAGSMLAAAIHDGELQRLPSGEYTFDEAALVRSESMLEAAFKYAFRADRARKRGGEADRAAARSRREALLH